jgi:precorrin-6A synthase
VKKILVIGIGPGDPDYLTIQAVNALNLVDVFFILDKGASKEKLLAFRKEICRRYIKKDHYRFVDAASPEWARDAEGYESTIDKLNRDKQGLFERLISEGMKDGECGAFLVWGDPSLYDSTIHNLNAIAKRGAIQFDYDVIPGISSIQALAAKHKTTLNLTGRPVQITTGRRLDEEPPSGADSIVVMLDSRNAYKRFADQDMDIYWGAYVGTADEILVAGKLKDVVNDIERIRTEARRLNGWIMDTYLMRRADDAGS